MATTLKVKKINKLDSNFGPRASEATALPTEPQPVWPDWAIFCTLGNHSKLMATINLAKSPTLLDNFCKDVKIIHLSSEIIFRQLLWTFGDFYLVTLTLGRGPFSLRKKYCLGSNAPLSSLNCSAESFELVPIQFVIANVTAEPACQTHVPKSASFLVKRPLQNCAETFQ